MKNKKMILMGVICALSLGLAVTTHANNEANLRAAAERGDLSKVNCYLNNGVSPNCADDYGNTALLLAVRCGHTNVIKRLADGGASDCCGQAMQIAYDNGDFSMMKCLYDNRRTRLNHPIDKFKESIEKHFLNKGKGPDCNFQIAKFIFEKYLDQKPVYNSNCKDRSVVYGPKGYSEFSEDNICELIDNNFIEVDDELYTYAFSKGYTRVCNKIKEKNKVKLDLVDNVNELFNYLKL